MINDLLPLDFDGARDGMLPTTSCSLPSSSGISFLRVPTDRRKEKRLLPFGRLAATIKPSVGRLAWATKGSNDLGGGILGKLGCEGHGQTIPEKEMSAMQKIILVFCLHCRHIACVTNTNCQHKMKTIRQLLETLPAELAAKAIRGAEMTAPQMMAERATDTATAIQKGIIWRQTVEGYAFWNAVYASAK